MSPYGVMILLSNVLFLQFINIF